MDKIKFQVHVNCIDFLLRVTTCVLKAPPPLTCAFSVRALLPTQQAAPATFRNCTAPVRVYPLTARRASSTCPVAPRRDWREKVRAFTGIFLDEPVDVNPAARAPGVKHDPVENPVRVASGGGSFDRMHHLRRRVESFWRGVEEFGSRVDHLGDRRARLRGSGRWVGDLREEVLRVGGVTPVAVEVGHVAVVPVVGRLRHEVRGQEPRG